MVPSILKYVNHRLLQKKTKSYRAIWNESINWNCHIAYYNFISNTLNILDRHPKTKGSFIILENITIHTASDIARSIRSRGYQCVFVPPYSPEPNPIEQFRSVCKSKLKREKLLQEEIFTSRIAMLLIVTLLKTIKNFAIILLLELQIV